MTRSHACLAALLALAPACLAVPASAAREPPSATGCLALLQSDAAAASDAARDWAAHGGADQAAECGALAAIALGDPAGGATTLDRLSIDATLPATRRAMLSDQASQAWLLAMRPASALESAAHAVSLVPADPVIRVDHARAAVAAARPEQALADLAPVLAAPADAPDRADALVVRATAYRRLDRLPQARADIDAACALMPDAPDALLERGILRERLGDLDGARADWSRVVSLSPDTREADQALQDLALLDAGPDAK